jgi:CRISPR-associated protein Csm1
MVKLEFDPQVVPLLKDFGRNEALAKRVSEIFEPMLLVSGDLSGIQNFIFNIKTDDKVARALKGRSFFVQLFSEVCLQFLSNSLKLGKQDVVFSGGGNFVFIAPASSERELAQYAKKIAEVLSGEELYLTLGWARFKKEDLNNYPEISKRVFQSVAAQKTKKFNMLSVTDVFEPFALQQLDKREYEDLTKDLSGAKGYEILKTAQVFENWQKPLNKLGYKIEFCKKPSKTAIAFHDKTYRPNEWNDVRFAVKDLPLWTPPLIQKFEPKNDDGKLRQQGNMIDFDGLAFFAKDRTGSAKIGVLKMDVDNLGKLFHENLDAAQRNAVDIAKVSRALSLFFEGQMNEFLNRDDFKSNIYPIFSGGDDFFVIGAWDKVFQFAKFIRRTFGDYVKHDDRLTLSAALLALDANFPVARFGKLAEERLHEAKNYREEKDMINVFDINLTWQEFEQAEALKTKLVTLVNVHVESRAMIEKMQKSTAGLKKILSDLKSRKNIYMPRVWRLAYYLRSSQKPESKAIIEEIVRQYETLIFKAFKGESANPLLISVAARWAEFETRKQKQDNQ